MDLVGIDELDTTRDDIFDTPLELLGPRALPRWIGRGVDQALIELVSQLVALLRRQGQELVPQLWADRHIANVPQTVAVADPGYGSQT